MTDSLFQFASTGSLVFPTIEIEPERLQWPRPPFNWPHMPVPENNVAQPCTIETLRERNIVH